jgi:hypothetical protein
VKSSAPALTFLFNKANPPAWSAGGSNSQPLCNLLDRRIDQTTKLAAALQNSTDKYPDELFLRCWQASHTDRLRTNVLAEAQIFHISPAADAARDGPNLKIPTRLKIPTGRVGH